MPSDKRRDRGLATRATLLAVGRRLFADKGFAATSIDDLVLAAEVTRGALYHHFADKEALFRAVFEELESSAQKYAEVLPSAELVLLDDALIFSPEDQPVAMADAIRRFAAA